MRPLLPPEGELALGPLTALGSERPSSPSRASPARTRPATGPRSLASREDRAGAPGPPGLSGAGTGVRGAGAGPGPEEPRFPADRRPPPALPPVSSPTTRSAPLPPAGSLSLTCPVPRGSRPLAATDHCAGRPIHPPRTVPRAPRGPRSPRRWQACRAGRPLLYGIQIFFRGFCVSSRGEAIPEPRAAGPHGAHPRSPASSGHWRPRPPARPSSSCRDARPTPEAPPRTRRPRPNWRGRGPGPRMRKSPACGFGRRRPALPAGIPGAHAQRTQARAPAGTGPTSGAGAQHAHPGRAGLYGSLPGPRSGQPPPRPPGTRSAPHHAGPQGSGRAGFPRQGAGLTGPAGLDWSGPGGRPRRD